MGESAIFLEDCLEPTGRKPNRRLFLSWIKVALLVVLGGFLYMRVLEDLVLDWWNNPALSQGMIIPPLAIWVAWIRRSWTLELPCNPDNRGLGLVVLACLLFILGKLGAEFFLLRISFVVLLAGIIATWWGYQRLRSLALPFLLLATMVPLPKVVYNSLATPLQLFASDTAATLAGDFGVAVYRDGNTITLASITLGVEEACSGLNSLSSLLVAAPLLGVLLCARLHSRVMLLALAIPFSIAVNILRITGTALLSDAHPAFAVGYYHFFSGWLIFLGGFLLLYMSARVLHRILD